MTYFIYNYLSTKSRRVIIKGIVGFLEVSMGGGFYCIQLEIWDNSVREVWIK